MMLQNKDLSASLDLKFPLLSSVYKVLYEGRNVEEEVRRILDYGNPI